MRLIDILRRRSMLLLIITTVTISSGICHGFSVNTSSSSRSSVSTIKDDNTSTAKSNNNILILDHINMNHQQGRHDFVKAFYVDLLQCTLDPRKIKNVEKGKGTVWANIGAHQFHLPEGSPDAQVLDGIITLVYPNLQTLLERYNNDEDTKIRSTLKESQLHVQEENRKDGNSGNSFFLEVTDPWGTKFHLIEGTNSEKDNRGCQPSGDEAEGYSMKDLTIYVPPQADLAGIGRFYEKVLGAKIVKKDNIVQIEMGPYQTLTFIPKEGINVDSHVDLREEEEQQEDCPASYLGNYGIHISLYVADLPSTYQRAAALGVAYVNTRFSRRAYTLEVRTEN